MDLDYKIRILLADDQPIVRQGLRYIIDAQDDMKVIGDVSDGDAAINAVKTLMPDIVLMDIQMPNYSGIEATRIIRGSYPDIKVVLLTTFDIQDYVFDGIRAGAMGYLLKDADTKDLLDGIRWVHQGQAIYRTALASRAIAEAFADENMYRASEKNLSLPEPLTEREIEVLQQMAYGRLYSEISEILHISLGTVKTHVHRIIQKLGVEERTQAVVFAIRQGIVK